MKSFDEVYRVVQPYLQEKEDERLLVAKSVKKGITVHVISTLAILGGGLLGFMEVGAPVWVIILLVVGGVIGNLVSYYGIYSKKLANFKESVKRDVIGGIVKGISPELNYNSKQGISRNIFKHSDIFKSRINRYKTEDRIWGLVGSTDIEMAEIKAERKETSRDSNGNTKTKYVTVFEGIFMVADFHKHFHGTTHVLPDIAESMFGWLGRKMQSMNWSRGEVAHMEDPDFEKAFVVYTDDQVEARYILSTSLMRRMLDLKKRFGSQVAFAFKESKVYIAISSKDNYFEPSYKKSLIERGNIEFFYKEVTCCLDIVEDLNLNTRIWSKQDGVE